MNGDDWFTQVGFRFSDARWNALVHCIGFHLGFWFDCGLSGFPRIDSHTLANAAFGIAPFFARAVRGSAHGAYTLTVGALRLFKQTHLHGPPLDPFSGL